MELLYGKNDEISIDKRIQYQMLCLSSKGQGLESLLQYYIFKVSKN
jgi:hypothetical protein